MLLCLVLAFSLLPAAALAEGETHNSHDGLTFIAWTDALASRQNGEGKTASNSLPGEAGSYYLTGDVVLTENNEIWNVPMGTVNLCLNGYGIKGYGISASGTLGSKDFPVIRIGACATLNLYDCGKTEHFFNESMDSSTPGMAIIDSSGKYTFTGGYITGGSGGDNGGGVYISEDMNFYPDGTVVKSKNREQ